MWFIPVYTGNTSKTRSSTLIVVVYPCVYREHLLTFFSLLLLNGLSLCIQGTQINNCLTDAITRFIPVCTGNT